MSELICTKCGAPLQNNAFYCSKCGAKVNHPVKIEVSEQTLAKKAKDEAKIAEQKAKKQERDAKREAKREENRIKRQTPAYKKMQKIVGITVPCSVIVVTLLLVFLLAPVQASTMGYDVSLAHPDFGGIKIDYFHNKTVNPEIPEEMWYLGAMRPVTYISNFAFYNHDSLTSIVIPDTVTTIGDYAFDGCGSLTSVTFGENSQLTTIGNCAFEGCGNLTSIVIPDGVTRIGYEAFRDCDSLTSVTIGNNVTTIGDYAFYYCHSLTSIVIPDGVTTIGYEAFSGCDSLTDIYYAGAEEQWNTLTSYSGCDGVTVHYNYAG